MTKGDMRSTQHHVTIYHSRKTKWISDFIQIAVQQLTKLKPGTQRALHSMVATTVALPVIKVDS